MSETPHNCPVCQRVFNWGDDSDSPAVAAKGVDWVSCRKNAYWKLHFHMIDAHPDALMTCGRRGNDGTKEDHWRTRDHHRACSYCGSMHPDELFAAIEAGCELGPTDKSYKVYVDLPNPEVGQTVEMGSSSGPPSAFPDATSAEIEAGRVRGPIMGTAGPHIHAKFYFQHLDEAAQQRFIDLLNAMKIKIGEPGYFYSRPFFIAPPQKASA